MKSLWSRWLGSRGTAEEARSKKNAARPACCLVDGSAWMNRRGTGRTDPRDMINMLQRLGRWAGRETVRTEVFFDGEPLRKAADGEAFSGVVARYAEGRNALIDAMRTRARAARREGYAVVLVTDQAGLEQHADRLSVDCMRPATLRKTIEGIGVEERRGGADGRDRNGGPRGGRRRRRKSAPPHTGDKANPPAQAPAPKPDTAKENDTVRTLIDVVE